MGDVENSQRPGKRKEQIKERERIKSHRVPLPDKGHTAMIERIPEGHFPAPKGFAMIKRERISEGAKIPKDEGLIAEDRMWESGYDENG